MGVREELAEISANGVFVVWLHDLVRETPSWLASMVFHMVVLLVLALWTLPQDVLQEPIAIIADQLDLLNKLPDPVDPSPLLIGFDDPDVLVPVPSADDDRITEFEPPKVPETYKAIRGYDEVSCGRPFGDPATRVGPPGGSGGIGRKKGFKNRAHTREGRAVVAALKWLAMHQMPDGGWCFDLKKVPSCRGQCRNSGNLGQARIGATAMAVLPFLGAGQTHMEGKYKATVSRGLYFLVNHMKVGANGGSLHEAGGNMYSHGLASIALCEAYAMTQDKGLHNPAQAAINFICYAQDPVGGGWRYAPRQPGDTSVVGWQIMALKSGHMAYLRVPRTTVKKTVVFLDSVQANSGAAYGYISPGDGQATTAIGLLCRMYLGWKKDDPALQRGAKMISNWGPSKTNMYYNYYATQVMRHFDGPTWKKWDALMKTQLVGSQAAAGHEKGSWFFKHGHADRGGRLYCTAMAAMTLEVYYRIQPIYGKQSTDDDFRE